MCSERPDNGRPNDGRPEDRRPHLLGFTDLLGRDCFVKDGR